MMIEQTRRRLGALPCDDCRGQGHTRGLFHPITCLACEGTGHVQDVTGRPIDTLAAAIVAQAMATDAAEIRRQRLAALDTGTPDRWTLRNNFRGD